MCQENYGTRFSLSHFNQGTGLALNEELVTLEKQCSFRTLDLKTNRAKTEAVTSSSHPYIQLRGKKRIADQHMTFENLLFVFLIKECGSLVKAKFKNKPLLARNMSCGMRLGPLARTSIHHDTFTKQVDTSYCKRFYFFNVFLRVTVTTMSLEKSRDNVFVYICVCMCVCVRVYVCIASLSFIYAVSVVTNIKDINSAHLMGERSRPQYICHNSLCV